MSIDLSDFDPYSPTTSTTRLFPASSTSSRIPSSSSSSSTTSLHTAVSSAQSSSKPASVSIGQDPLNDWFGELELGAQPSSSSTSTSTTLPPSSDLNHDILKTHSDRRTRVLSDLSRDPFTSSSPPPPIPLSHSTQPQQPPTHPSRSASGFSPPRRLSSLMDVQPYQNYSPQSPPLATSPTLDPFHPSSTLSANFGLSPASRRMRQASEGGGGDSSSSTSTTGGFQWDDFNVQQLPPASSASKSTTTTTTTKGRKSRERTISGEWGDFQTASSTPERTDSPGPVDSISPPLPPLPPVSMTSSSSSSSSSSKRKPPSPRRSSTTPTSISRPPHDNTRKPLHSHSTASSSAATTQRISSKDLPPPPLAPNAFDPFAQAVQLVGVRSGVHQILTETIAEGVRPSLPPRLRISPRWTLLYSLDQHGISLTTLFTQLSTGLSSRPGGFLLVVRTERGEVCGGYCSEALKPTDDGGGSSGFSGYHGRTGGALRKGSLATGNRVWGGDGSCFLFKTIPLPPSDPRLSPLIKTFPPTFRNTYFQHSSTSSGIALGGGNDGVFGLWIDERLERGWTGTSETFGNDRLVEGKKRTSNGNLENGNGHANGNGNGRSREENDGDEGKFEVVGLECWAVGT